MIHASKDFPTDDLSIKAKLNNIDPIKYRASRNYIDGAVTGLSPYISRGYMSTKEVLLAALKKEIPMSKMEKFVQELAWRDYWQQIWIAKGEGINQDLKRTQPGVVSKYMPCAVCSANTTIGAIDQAIKDLYSNGYMHNHVRMYVASIVCNLSHSYWLNPAKWMYYHLLDGDWASNALSWQWVAGANANKLYYANQENINRYCHTSDKSTFLDVPYEQFENMEVPVQLQEREELILKTELPNQVPLILNLECPTYVYNSYNLDAEWDVSIEANRILLLDPNHFKDYPISKNVLDFILKLSSNIEGLQLFIGSFEELKVQTKSSQINYKEHPFSLHYEGILHEREWLFPVTGYFPSFFAYWKKCKKTDQWNEYTQNAGANLFK